MHWNTNISARYYNISVIVYFICFQLTYADIALFSLLDVYLTHGSPTLPKEFAGYPLVIALYVRVTKIPRLADYLKTRPDAFLWDALQFSVRWSVVVSTKNKMTYWSTKTYKWLHVYHCMYCEFNSSSLFWIKNRLT